MTPDEMELCAKLRLFEMDDASTRTFVRLWTAAKVRFPEHAGRMMLLSTELGADWELSMREAARRLGCSEATVRRDAKRLRELLVPGVTRPLSDVDFA